MLINYTDSKNKGFIDFKEFSLKLRRNMINDDEKGFTSVLGSQPQVIRSARNIKNLPNITKTFN
jgi:hypothetical protein